MEITNKNYRKFSNLILYIFYIIISLSFCYSCNTQPEKDMIIYEITMVERYEVLEGISKSNKKTLVVLVNQTMEKIEFCFFNADDLKTKEISSISNTFLKLDDNFLVPVVFKEDFILTGHSSTLEQIKCNFYYLR